MKIKFYHIALVFFLFTNCDSLYQVSNKENEGIPFLVHQVLETTTMTHQENFFQIDLEMTWREIAKPEAKAKISGRKEPTRKNKTENSSEGKKEFVTKVVKYSTIECGLELNTSFGSKKTMKDAYNSIFGQLLADPPQTKIGSNCTYFNAPFPLKSIKELYGDQKQFKIKTKLVKTSIDRKVTPHPKPRYINIKKGLTGSTEATITLNENGTLASATGKVQDDFLGKMIDTLPISDAISAIFNIPSSTESESIKSVDSELVKMKLTLLPIKRNYLITKENFLNDNSTSPILPTATSYSTFDVLESKGTLLNKAKEEKKEEGEKLKISGEIVLPKTDE